MERVEQYKVVPVVVINKVEETLPKMQALCDEGLYFMQLSFTSISGAAEV